MGERVVWGGGRGLRGPGCLGGRVVVGGGTGCWGGGGG